jgi:hypothetical protein
LECTRDDCWSFPWLSYQPADRQRVDVSNRLLDRAEATFSKRSIVRWKDIKHARPIQSIFDRFPVFEAGFDYEVALVERHCFLIRQLYSDRGCKIICVLCVLCSEYECKMMVFVGGAMVNFNAEVLVQKHRLLRIDHQTILNYYGRKECETISKIKFRVEFCALVKESFNRNSADLEIRPGAAHR